MTHTHTIAELRTAVAAGTEPSPCLARRTGAVLAGGHARSLVRIADGRGAPRRLAEGTYSKHAVFLSPASYRPRPHPGPARGGQDAPGDRRQVDRLGSRPAP